MLPSLDRMAIEFAAANPEGIAAEIHRQLGDIAGPVPVYEIAQALDIEEIRDVPLRGFEAMLLTDASRRFGCVVLNSSSHSRRRRFSLAHELGHFLFDWHQAIESSYLCTRDDMRWPAGSQIHIRQENEANRFAIELLAPARLLTRYLRRLPDLDHILAIHRDLDISKIAAARRYANLHKQPIAIVISKNGEFTYTERSASFPFLAFRGGDRLPDLPRVPLGVGTSEMVETDAEAWQLDGDGADLFVQVLAQDQGHSLILLHLEKQDDS